MPVKSIFPSLGKKCGRREREADAKWGQREQSFGQSLSSRRSKAPWSSERWCPSRGTVGTRVLVGPSRFVRGLFPRRMGAPMTVGCSLGAEEGNVVSVTLKAYAPDARGGHTKRDFRGHVLHSVQRPVHVNRHNFGRRKSNEGGAVLGASRLGKPTEVGGTNTGVTGIGRKMRGSPRTTGSLGDAAWCEKEKEGG
jgi:hypothetical protein